MKKYTNIISWIVDYDKTYTLWNMYSYVQERIVETVCDTIYGLFNWSKEWGEEGTPIYDILNDRTKGYDMEIARLTIKYKNYEKYEAKYEEVIKKISNDIMTGLT